MSDKQYRVARKGVVEQLRTAQKLHCKHMEQKYKEALEKLEKRFLLVYWKRIATIYLRLMQLHL